MMELKTTFFQKAFLILLGIFLSLFLIETGLRLGGFTLLAVQERRNRVSIKKVGSYRILCLGESTTHGQYPPFLEADLNRSGTGIQFTVIDKGRAGINTDAILTRVESYLDKYHPDMVVAMMGINDPGAVHLPADTPSASKPALFIKSFKTYKLARLLLHMAFKTNRWSLPPEDMQAQLTTLPAIPAAGPDTEDTEPVKKLKKELKLNPGNDEAYLELGWVYREQEKFHQAEMYIKKALKINPGHVRGYVDLGWLYLKQRKYQQAEIHIQKALRINPLNEGVYLQFGELYRDQGKFQQAEMYIKKALRINPGNDAAYGELGATYLEQRKFHQAEMYVKKSLKINPDNDRICVQLGMIYWEQAKFQQAYQEFKKALQINPGNAGAYYVIDRICLEREQSCQAKEPYYRKATRRYIHGYNLFTANNYHALKTILDKRKIRLVCVQYPMRDITPLKNIFKGKAEDIVFVDNERVFREAVKKEGYGAYFRDMFGGNFGHCTDTGNKLLGENIAGVILREVFHKKFLLYTPAAKYPEKTTPRPS